MITVTENAKRMLKKVLVTSDAEPEGGLRLLPAADGTFVLALSRELSADVVVEYEGFKVLLVGIEYFGILSGKTVDCDYSRDEPALIVR